MASAAVMPLMMPSAATDGDGRVTFVSNNTTESNGTDKVPSRTTLRSAA